MFYAIWDSPYARIDAFNASIGGYIIIGLILFAMGKLIMRLAVRPMQGVAGKMFFRSPPEPEKKKKKKKKGG